MNEPAPLILRPLPSRVLSLTPWRSPLWTGPGCSPGDGSPFHLRSAAPRVGRNGCSQGVACSPWLTGSPWQQGQVQKAEEAGEQQAEDPAQVVAEQEAEAEAACRA